MLEKQRADAVCIDMQKVNTLWLGQMHSKRPVDKGRIRAATQQQPPPAGTHRRSDTISSSISSSSSCSTADGEGFALLFVLYFFSKGGAHPSAATSAHRCTTALTFFSTAHTRTRRPVAAAALSVARMRGPRPAPTTMTVTCSATEIDASETRYKPYRKPGDMKFGVSSHDVQGAFVASTSIGRAWRPQV